MKSLSKRRRVAVACAGGVAAVAGLPVLLHNSSHTSTLSGGAGFVCGLFTAIVVGVFVKRKMRRDAI